MWVGVASICTRACTHISARTRGELTYPEGDAEDGAGKSDR